MGSRPRSATDWSALSTIQTSCVLQHGAQCTAVRRKRLTSQYEHSATAISVAECVACILSSDAGRGPGARSMSTARLRIPARIARIDAGRGPDGRPSANLAIRMGRSTAGDRAEDAPRRPTHAGLGGPSLLCWPPAGGLGPPCHQGRKRGRLLGMLVHSSSGVSAVMRQLRLLRRRQESWKQQVRKDGFRSADGKLASPAQCP